MTTAQTIKTLRKAGKPVSLTHLYRLFAVLNIEPIGRSRPQQYPQDTAARILTHLGFSSVVTEATQIHEGAPSVVKRAAHAGKLISVPKERMLTREQIKAAKPQPKTKGKS